MDVSGIASLAPGLEQATTENTVSLAVLKMALDSQASSAAALLDALPPVTAVNLPSHLGQNINTVA